jgi:uncharacterized membrane protein
VDGAIIARSCFNYASTHEIRQLPFWGRGIGRKSDILLSDTAIVFSLALVMVQFSSTAYSPRLVLWLSRDPIIWHAIGIFTATFLFALVVLGWVDRNGSGHVPFFSTWAVIVLLIASVLVLARLVQRLTIPQVTEVLYYISQRGRQVIHEVYPPPSRRWTTSKICCDGSASDILRLVSSGMKAGLYG